ncbi:MAG: ferritin [Ignavibacteriota bacterium]|jgi:ferritin|nr:MAG: ferritin [Chlorobiota bacterium]MBE7477402.1 ferritin [Ignavibacteriales bacterium]MBL1122803.1 ferritin [Ignavibacteriota bacterium]MBV6421994.1 Bacterial non-heme ferritin [Ignavibacteriaceae bacterium]MCE7855824.1 ferritin [Ignavibacteria bacterium CHB3]MEB2296304.1 ferritin [Ignavibacteria bacterium]
MSTKKMQDALNKQLTDELYSSYLYLSIAAHFEEQSLKGFANWFRIQSQEEYGHAMKFYNFIIRTDGRVILTQIDAPKTSWKNVMDAFKDTLTHEKKITGLIHKLVDLSIQSKDYATNNFLQWFVNEQVEEEATVEEIIRKLEMIGDNKGGLYMLDRELGARTAAGN